MMHQADWSVCLGEPALDVMVCRFSKAASLFTPDILVIGGWGGLTDRQTDSSRQCCMDGWMDGWMDHADGKVVVVVVVVVVADI